MPKPATAGVVPKLAVAAVLPESKAQVDEAQVDEGQGDEGQGEGADRSPSSHGGTAEMDRERPSRHAWDEAVAHAGEAPAEADQHEDETGNSEPQRASSGAHDWDAVLSRTGCGDDLPLPSSDAQRASPSMVLSQGDPLHRAAGHFDEGFQRLRDGDRAGALFSWREALNLAPANRKYQTNLRKLEAMVDNDPASG